MFFYEKLVSKLSINLPLGLSSIQYIIIFIIIPVLSHKKVCILQYFYKILRYCVPPKPDDHDVIFADIIKPLVFYKICYGSSYLSILLQIVLPMMVTSRLTGPCVSVHAKLACVLFISQCTASVTTLPVTA